MAATNSLVLSPGGPRWERAGVRVDTRELPDFTVFRDVDTPWCPEMVVIPAGQFLMGAPPDEPKRSKDEGPHHPRTLSARCSSWHFARVDGRDKPGQDVRRSLFDSWNNLTIVFGNPVKRVWQSRINEASRDIDCFPRACDPTPIRGSQ
jgi:hypothetical protein